MFSGSDCLLLLGRPISTSLRLHELCRPHHRPMSIKLYPQGGLPNEESNLQSQYTLPTIMLTNANSIMNKTDHMFLSVHSSNVDCFAVTETWLNDDIPNDPIALTNFNIERRDRPVGRGGGVLLYIRNVFRYNRLGAIESDDFEVLWISIRPRILPRPFNIIIFCVIYSPPWYSADKKRELISYITNCIDMLNKRYTNALYFITGDFNTLDTSFLSHIFRFKQTVTKNTRGDKILDMIYTNHHELYENASIIAPLGKSDHACVLLRPIAGRRKPVGFTMSLRRNINPMSLQFLRNELSSIPWQRMYCTNDCQLQADFFYNEFLSVFNRVMPLTECRVKNNDKPWITPYFKRVIAERNRAFKNGDTVLYKKLRNKTEHLRRHSKKQYFFRQIENFKKGDPRTWWKEIKRVSGLPTMKESNFLDHITSTDNEFSVQNLPDMINSFFISVSSGIAPLDESVLQSQRDQLDPYSVPDSFIVSEFEVFQAINRLKDNKATGPDLIPNSVVKALADVLCGPLCAVINTSVRTGVIPWQWRISRIAPIPKTIPPRFIETDLRPIAITSTFSKIAESFVNGFFNEHFDLFLDPDQFGNTKSRSTTFALVKLAHKLFTCSDSHNVIQRVLFVDFRKAFDCVSHNVLAKKLTEINFDPHVISWFLSFLHNRYQYTVVNKKMSKINLTNAGTPQGTITGPSNFKLLINDLTFDIFYIKYVDDLTAVTDSIDPNDNTMQCAVDNLLNWCNVNDMKVNVKKTLEMIVTFGRLQKCSIPLLNTPVDGHIQRCSSYKILGVIFNENLTWDDHVDYILKKAAKRFYIIYALIRAGVSDADIVTIFCSLIRSILEYACQVWHPGLTKKQSNSIESVQKRLLRLLFPDSPYSESLKLSGLQSLYNRREQLANETFQQIKDPNHVLHNLLKTRQPINKSVRNFYPFEIPRGRTNRLNKSFINYCIQKRF